MASKNIFHAKGENNSCILENPDGDFNPVNDSENLFEFSEADIWTDNSADSQLEAKKIVPSSRTSRKGGRNLVVERSNQPMTCAASSLPVNIPDWSKIYMDHHHDHGQDDYDDDDHGGDDDEEGRVPPHEYLIRRRGASFSVHEGKGRTLKGRDLRQVRNAIWEKVGFED
ncbi:hypothetical protein P3X46_004029 [Hevea brasiliensis]|uniref:Senescence regulator n=1 Tax=Hevea brasiliensis TaxID=3981 RepID=A0ABQ9MVX8_HEVBR|nr:protein S40-4-like [Hevea brasiliensis]KAJ9184286.1 hypothetical protein P3X46_004029 [Hevea brasiliensis]